jgi:hypothetical protein
MERISQKKKKSYHEIYEIEQKMHAVESADPSVESNTNWRDITSWWQFWLT